MPIEEIIVNIRANIHEFARVMKQPLSDFKSLTERIKNQSRWAGRLADRIRGLTHGMRGFRMEMLSVMFFGLGMQRFFTGLLRPALEITGIFELWGSVLQLLFLPVALALLDVLLPIFEWIMNLDEATKLAIGKFVLFMAGLGLVLFLVGSLTLAIGGLILAFGGIFTIIDKLIPDFSIFGMNVSSFIEAGLGIGVVSALFALFKDKVGQLWEKFKKLEFVQTIFNLIKDKIKELIEGDNSPLNMFKNFWIEFKKKIDELKIKDFKESLDKIGKVALDIAPKLETMAGALKSVANVIEFLAKHREIIGIIFGATVGGTFAGPLGLIAGGIAGGVLAHKTRKQFGGFIPQTGLYQLHAGEQVIPANQTMNFSPVINISTTGGVDIERIKYELNQMWATQLSQLARS